MSADNKYLSDCLKPLSLMVSLDDDSEQQSVVGLLQPRVRTVVTAIDERSVIQNLCEVRPDLIITGTRMLQVCGQVLYDSQSDAHNIPLILLADPDDIGDLRNAINSHVDQIVLKPLDAPQLDRALSRIGGRLRMERELREATDSLELNNERYRAIFWTAMEAFCVFHWESLNILEVNRQFQMLYGISAERASGENLALFFDNHYGGELRSIMLDASNQPEPMILRHIDLEKEIFPVEMTVGQFRANGVHLGLMAVRRAGDRMVGGRSL